jgi:hypothetical protein
MSPGLTSLRLELLCCLHPFLQPGKTTQCLCNAMHWINSSRCDTSHDCICCLLSDTLDTYLMRNSGGAIWCNACGFHGNSKTDVVRHIEARHLSSHIECKFCQKVLNCKRNLQRHIRKHHHHDKMDMKQIIAWHITPE